MPKKRKRFKKASKLLVVVGSLSLLMLSPIHHNDTLGKYMNSLTGRMEAQAAEADPFSPRWEIDGNGNWFYHLDSGGVATNAWVQDEVNGDWYLLSETGAMRVGLFQSNGGKYYLLDTVQGTGHYGRLLKNGQEFGGVIIQADTSADYEGALSEATLQQLEAQGLVSRGSAPNVSNTQHVSNGVVTSTGGRNTSSSGSSVTVNGEQFTISPWGVYGEGSVSDGSGSSLSDADDDFEKNYNERLRKMAEELDNDPKLKAAYEGKTISNIQLR